MPRYRERVRQGGHGRAEPPGCPPVPSQPAWYPQCHTALSPQACAIRSAGCTQGQAPPSPEKFNGRFPEKWSLPATPCPKASLSPLPLKALVLDGCHRLFSFFLSFLLTPQDFSGGPGATSLCSRRRGLSATPGQGTRPRVLQLRAGTARENDLMLQTPAHRPRDHSPHLGGRDGQHRLVTSAAERGSQLEPRDT